MAGNPSPFSDVTETVFADKTVLDEEYQPSKILERDAEISAYTNALRHVLFGRNPQNVFVYGKAGVGKTAVTQYMLDALRTEAADRSEADRLHVLFHNCNGDSAYGTLRSLINTLREVGPNHDDAFPKKGLSMGDALETFYGALEERGGTFLLVLDEIDHLSDANSLLYELPRARANGHLDDAKVGVIGISNNYTFRDSLAPKVKDTLMETEISFSPYDADELYTILEHRVEQAFVDDGCDSAAISKSAALAARDTGSARQAIDLLRTGGDIAEERGESTVTAHHIDEAQDRVQRGRATDKIRDQTRHGQLVLEAVARLERAGESPVRSKRIQATYEDVARSAGTDPLTTLKSIQNHLGDLTMLGFLNRTEQNEGQSGGVYYEYELALSAEAVFEAREAIEAERA